MTDDPVLLAAYFVLLGGLGLIAGSFLNVVIHRVPLGMSVMRSPSACPSCQAPITARDNIPVVSWLLLRGRCRACGVSIPARYPMVEALTGLAWLAVGWWAVAADDGSRVDPLLPLLLVLGSAGVALAFIDLDHHRLPDVIVLPLYPVTVLGLVLAGLVESTWPVLPAVGGVVAWLVIIGGLWLVTGGRAMGFGDVKLAPVLGATLGWVAFGASVVGAVRGIRPRGARRPGPRGCRPGGPAQPRAVRPVPHRGRSDRPGGRRPDRDGLRQLDGHVSLAYDRPREVHPARRSGRCSRRGFSWAADGEAEPELSSLDRWATARRVRPSRRAGRRRR